MCASDVQSYFILIIAIYLYLSAESYHYYWSTEFQYHNNGCSKCMRIAESSMLMILEDTGILSFHFLCMLSVIVK